MQNNDCIHKFGSWKQMKKAVIDCESSDQDAKAFIGIRFTRKCKECGFVETKFEKANKKGKHLGLKMQ